MGHILLVLLNFYIQTNTFDHPKVFGYSSNTSGYQSMHRYAECNSTTSLFLFKLWMSSLITTRQCLLHITCYSLICMKSISTRLWCLQNNVWFSIQKSVNTKAGSKKFVILICKKNITKAAKLASLKHAQKHFEVQLTTNACPDLVSMAYN